jgi:hypothetical protein
VTHVKDYRPVGAQSGGRKKFFAVRLYSKRTAKILCRAYCMTHGKEALCRAPDKRRTAKIETHGKGRVSGSV